jgi:hypothetical protein
MEVWPVISSVSYLVGRWGLERLKARGSARKMGQVLMGLMEGM